MKTRLATGVALIVSVFGLSGCSGSGDDIVGNWQADDGSVKTISESGACTGMYYNQGQPLDIGGSMSCSFSKDAGANGRHTLVVVQGPNRETLEVEFKGADTVVLYDGSGNRLAKLTRM